MATFEERTKKNGQISYRAIVRRKNRPEISKTFPSKEEAADWAKKVEHSLSSKLIKSFLMNDMFDRYQMEILPSKSKGSINSEKHHIIFWRECLGKEFIDDVESIDIESFADSLYKKSSRTTGLSLTSESRRKYLCTLSFIFNIAMTKWKWTDYNPVYGVDKHIDRLAKQKKEKSIRIDILDPLKRSFIEGIEHEMKRVGITSKEGLAKSYCMPKSSIQNLLDPTKNSSIFAMAELANMMGLEFKFTYTKVG